MTNTQVLIATAYSAFNRRDIDGALALMRENVRWPKASEGGHVVGKEEIRAYWTRQWSDFDPHVEPIEVYEGAQGRTDVRVHQLVKSLEGDVLSDSEVWHVYTISDGLDRAHGPQGERCQLGFDSIRSIPEALDLLDCLHGSASFPALSADEAGG